ncbi:MAG: hypothetical protein KAJ62_10215 [Desulfobacteraceae bacterium]|nr:hypothetical protein [Desulfobacteraceae bacterium]
MTKIETDGFLSEEIINSKDYFMDQYADIFDFANNLNRFSMDLMRSQKVDWEDKRKFILKTLHIRIIENYQATIMLLQFGMVSQAKVLVRGMLETVFILVALQKKPDLIQSYYDQFEEGRRRALKASCQFKGEELKKAAKEHNLETHYVEQKKFLKNKELNSLRPKQWAIAAELEDFYNLWYTLYSNSAHSNLPALDDHIDKTEKDINLSFGPTSKYLCETFQCCAYIMLNANSSMALCYNQDKKSELDAVYEKIKDIDEKYLIDE